MTEAEQYAVLYPNRARRIRAEGGLPARLDYGPPEPHIVDAIVNGAARSCGNSTGNLPSVPPHDHSISGRDAVSRNGTLRRNR
jgi:hypothetical protein